MSKEDAKIWCKIGIAKWGKIFFVENEDYYKKLIEKAVKKMGHIQFDNPVRVKGRLDKKRICIISSIDYMAGRPLCAVYFHNKIDSLNCYDTLSIVRVGRELVKTLNRLKVKI